MRWTSSETLTAAGQRRQLVLERLQDAEVLFRFRLLRGTGPLGRLGAAELLRVSQREGLPVYGSDPVRRLRASDALHPPGAPGGRSRRGVPSRDHRRERRGAGLGPRALVERDFGPRVAHLRAQVLAVHRRQPPTDMQARPGSWRQPRVGQVGIEGTGDVDDHLRDDVRRIESCSRALV